MASIERGFVAAVLVVLLVVQPVLAAAPDGRVVSLNEEVTSFDIDVEQGTKKLKVEWSVSPGYGTDKTWSCDQTERSWTYFLEQFDVDIVDANESTIDTFTTSAFPQVNTATCQTYNDDQPSSISGSPRILTVTSLAAAADTTLAVETTHTFEPRQLAGTVTNSGCYYGGGSYGTGGISIEVTRFPRCSAPAESVPAVTVKKTARDHADIKVTYAFPADVTERTIILKLLPWTDAKGRSYEGEIVQIWSGSDPALENNGPFAFSDYQTPSDARQVQFVAEASYFNDEDECEGVQLGYGAIDCASCGTTVGDPVSVVDGNMRLADVDPLPPLLERALTRTFDSGHGRDGFFGVGWTTMFDQVINIEPNPFAPELIHFTTPENDQVAFAGDGSQIWPSNVRVPGTLFQAGNGAYAYRSPDGRTETFFDPEEGFFVGMRDVATGREISVLREVDGVGMVTEIYAEDSWTGMSWTMEVSNNLVQSVTTDASLTWTYAYDSNGLLLSVTGPDGTWRTYEYGTGGIMEARDAKGRLIESHTYDSNGRATSSSGPSDEITSIQYDLSAPAGQTRTRVTTAGGAVSDIYLKDVGGSQRVVERSGGCASCGWREEVVAYDDKGRVVRQQDVDGYITTNVYTGPLLTGTMTFLRPSGCDPETSSTHCHLTPDALASVTLASTGATKAMTYAFDDANWPGKVTSVVSTSVLQSGETRTELSTYDEESGQRLTSSISGWTGYPTATEETRTTTTTLYDGSEGAAFDPGGSFPISLSQPKLPKSVDGPRTLSDVTEYVYYPIEETVDAASRGRLAAVRNASGHVTRFEDYDAFGNARRVIDANSTAIETTTDSIGRALVSTIKAVDDCNTTLDPLCNTDLVTTRVYDDHGPLLSETRADGGVSVFEYDDRGRLATLSRGPATSDLREQLETTYDASSGKKSLERYLAKESGGWVEKRSEGFTYDDEGRLEEQIHADDESVAYAYDYAGRVGTMRDENHTSANTTYAYGAAGRLESVTQRLDSAPGDAISTSYTYDLDGNITGVTDPNGNVTQYLFDDFGQMLQQASPVIGITRYVYDTAGQLSAVTDANGATITRTYDGLGRLLSSEAVRGTESETVSWAYDDEDFGVGRLTSMADPTGVTEYRYDRRGLLLSEEKTIGEVPYLTAYRYDASGNRSRIVYPSDRIVDYTFDYAGRPASASSGSTSIVTSAAYLPFGEPTSLVFGNGTTKTMSYDNRYEPSTNVLTGPSGPIASFEYDHDASGNITAIRDALDGGYDRALAYDDLNRLVVAVSGSSLWGNGEFQYDAMGNIQSLYLGAAINRSFSYDGSTPKLSQVWDADGSHEVTYDAAGNELATGSFSSAYSPRNLVALGGASTYAYDGRGIRTVTTAAHGIVGLSLDVESVPGGRDVAGHVTISAPAPASGLTIELSDDRTEITTPASVDIPEGETSADFSLSVAPPMTVQVATITATLGTSVRTTMLELQPSTLESLSLDTPIGGGAESGGCIALTGAAPAGGIAVDLSSSHTSATVPASVTVAAGEQSACFAIETSAVVNPITAVITAAYAAVELEAELEVMPPGAIEVYFDDGQLTDGASTNATVVLNLPAPPGGAVVGLAADPATYLAVPSTVTVAQGETEGIVSVTADGPVPEMTSVVVTSTYNGYPAEGELFVLPPAVVSLTLTPTTVEGGQEATAEVTLATPAAAGTQVYLGSDSNRADPPSSVTIDEGETTGEASIPTVPVAATSSAVITAELPPTNATASLTIEPLALTLDSASISPTTIVGSNDATLTVTLTEEAEAGGLEVELGGVPSPWLDRPPSIIVPDGQLSASVPVHTSLVEEAKEVMIISTHAATRRDVNFTITPPVGNHVVSIVPASGHPTGGDLVTATLTLAAAAGSGGSEVLLSSSNTAVATVPATVTVSEGNTTATFDIDTDAVVATADVILTAVYGGVTVRRRFTVLPTSTTIALDSVSIVSTTFSGESAAGSVTLTAPAPAGGIEVTLGGSRAGLATVPPSVTVPEGETTAAFTVTTEVSSSSHNVVVTAAYEGIERSATLLIIYGVEVRSPRTDAVTALHVPAQHTRRTHRITVTAPARTTRRSAPADIVATTVDPPKQRFSFYTPELNLMAETELTTDAEPAVEWEYVWFAGQPVAQIETATGEIAWYFNDHLGTPILQTDDSATTIWRVEREPFGKTYATRAGTSRHQPLSFPGQEEVGETSYNIHRWYRSGWGRYTQADPIGTAGDPNPYHYALANPAILIDPLGLASQKDCKKKKDVCDEIERNIKAASSELRRLLRNENLPEDSPKSAFEYWRRYDGHVDQFENRRRQLDRWRQKWNDEGCGGDPPNYYGYTDQPYPDFNWDEFRSRWRKAINSKLESINDFMNDPRTRLAIIAGAAGAAGPVPSTLPN